MAHEAHCHHAHQLCDSEQEASAESGFGFGFASLSHFPQESAWQDEPLVRVQDMPCGRYQADINLFGLMPGLRPNAGA